MGSVAEERLLTVEVEGVSVEVLRKPIRRLYLRVYPPDGRVRLTAPLHAGDGVLRAFLLARIGWVRRRQAALAARPRAPRPEYVTGESVAFFGGRLALEVVEQAGRACILPRGKEAIVLRVRPGSGRDGREAVLRAWLRGELDRRIGALLARWQPVLGVRASSWGVRAMRTRWGTCHLRKRRITLNLELAARPPSCLEYVVVHELTHLLEPGHGLRFQALMDRFLPDWRRTRAELNRPAQGAPAEPPRPVREA